MFLGNWVRFMRSGHFCVGWWYNEMKCEEMYEENEEQMKKMKRISEKMVKVKNDASKK